jgi:hypothetical protein
VRHDDHLHVGEQPVVELDLHASVDEYAHVAFPVFTQAGTVGAGEVLFAR